MSLGDTFLSNVLVGLPEICVVDVVDDGLHLTITFEKVTSAPSCPTCSTPMHLRDRCNLNLVDLPYRGRPARII